MVRQNDQKDKFLAVTSLLLLIAVGFLRIEVKGTDHLIEDEESEIIEDVVAINSLNKALSNIKYSDVKEAYHEQLYQGAPIHYTIADLVYEEEQLTNDAKGYSGPVLSLERGTETSLTLEVVDSGVYGIIFDYYDLSDSILNVEMSLQVNGQFPYYELRSLQFESNWVNEREIVLDRYGHEIVPTPEKVLEWNQKPAHDSSYRHSDPLGIFLESGVNELTLNISEGSFLLGDITLKAIEAELEPYEVQPVVGNEFIVIEGEQMTKRNDSSIRATAEFNPDLTPYHTSKRVLNLLDGWSFKDPGQRIDYTFTVETSGYYYLAFTYRQDFRVDFPVFRELYLNGEIPNDQLRSYPFPYTRQMDNLFISDRESDKPMSLYLEAGVNTLSLVVNIDPIRHVIEGIDSMMAQINEFSLQVNRLSGGRQDRFRTIDLERFIPNTQDLLYGWADELAALADSVAHYNPDAKQIGAFSQIDIVVNQLRSLGEYPNRIPRRINELSEGPSSVITLLASLNQDLNYNPLAIDKIFITQNTESLPDGVGFLTKAVESVKRFVNSFTDEAYSPSNTHSDHLQVWVNRPRQYVEIIQQMADEHFTPATGIQIDFSLMPDQNRLILANASGTAPDVAAAIHFALPFELGIRDALVDLTKFSDFEEVATSFPQGLLVPSMIEGGLYSIPETMNFFVLFYRTDILESLNIPIPQTMAEVTEILPELQRLGMNFFHQSAGMIGFKNFAATMPLIYQNNGSFYDQTVLNTAIDSEEAIAGIRQLTDLFTIYNIPYEVPSFYQHFRGGLLPIGIAEYGMYNLLINAAPELSNLWDIALIPGVENDEGEILRYSSGGAENLMIFESSSKQEEAWEYLKWWTSTEMQIEFGQRLQTTYGQEFLWNTANLQAYANLPWDSDHKDVIIAQNQWLQEAPRVPGSYMLERELSNAVISIILDGQNERRAIDLAVKRTNRETMRKLEEFGFIRDGEVIHPYRTPSLELLREKEEN